MQENASRYSCLQWSQRTRANPRSKSPQSRNLLTDLRDDRAQDAVAGLVAFLVDIQERIEVSRRTVARDLDFLRDQGRVKGIGVRLSF